MLLTQQGVGEIRQLIDDGQLAALAQIKVQQMSLGGVLDLACCADEKRGEVSLRTTAFFRNLEQHFPLLTRGIILLKQTQFVLQSRQEELFSAPDFEIAPVHAGWLESSDWQLFLHRFSRTLRQRGYGERFPSAFAGAFGEMADNVVQHSAARDQPCARGLAGFHVNETQATFVVVDLGRGLLASLRGNPRWQHLRENAQALEAVVRQRATRKTQNQFGDGFSELFNALVDRNGVVCLRSLEASLRLGSERYGRRFDLEFGPKAPGVSISVTCALRGEPQEIPLPAAEKP